MTASSRCPCGKTHARLPDGGIGNVPDVPPPPPLNPGGWLLPGDETLGERFHRYADQINGYMPTRREVGPRPGQIMYADGVMEWDNHDTGEPVRRVHLGDVRMEYASLAEDRHRSYASTPVPGRWTVQDGRLEWEPTAETVTYRPPRI